MTKTSTQTARPWWIAPTALFITLGGAAGAVAIWIAPLPQAMSQEPVIHWTDAGSSAQR